MSLNNNESLKYSYVIKDVSLGLVPNSILVKLDDYAHILGNNIYKSVDKEVSQVISLQLNKFTSSLYTIVDSLLKLIILSNNPKDNLEAIFDALNSISLAYKSLYLVNPNLNISFQKNVDTSDRYSNRSIGLDSLLLNTVLPSIQNLYDQVTSIYKSIEKTWQSSEKNIISLLKNIDEMIVMASLLEEIKRLSKNILTNFLLSENDLPSRKFSSSIKLATVQGHRMTDNIELNIYAIYTLDIYFELPLEPLYKRRLEKLEEKLKVLREMYHKYRGICSEEGLLHKIKCRYNRWRSNRIEKKIRHLEDEISRLNKEIDKEFANLLNGLKIRKYQLKINVKPIIYPTPSLFMNKNNPFRPLFGYLLFDYIIRASLNTSNMNFLTDVIKFINTFNVIKEEAPQILDNLVEAYYSVSTKDHYSKLLHAIYIMTSNDLYSENIASLLSLFVKVADDPKKFRNISLFLMDNLEYIIVGLTKKYTLPILLYSIKYDPLVPFYTPETFIKSAYKILKLAFEGTSHYLSNLPEYYWKEVINNVLGRREFLKILNQKLKEGIESLNKLVIETSPKEIIDSINRIDSNLVKMSNEELQVDRLKNYVTQLSHQNNKYYSIITGTPYELRNIDFVKQKLPNLVVYNKNDNRYYIISIPYILKADAIKLKDTLELIINSTPLSILPSEDIHLNSKKYAVLLASSIYYSSKEIVKV